MAEDAEPVPHVRELGILVRSVIGLPTAKSRVTHLVVAWSRRRQAAHVKSADELQRPCLHFPWCISRRQPDIAFHHGLCRDLGERVVLHLHPGRLE
jgi:hypothetical protein